MVVLKHLHDPLPIWCGTVMPAEQFFRRFEDLPIGSWKLRWYCVCCGTRYKTKFGMRPLYNPHHFP